MSVKFCEQRNCPSKLAALNAMAVDAWRSGTINESGQTPDQPPEMGLAVAQARIFWPGHAGVEVCERCAAWARAVAEAMGFKLHEELMLAGGDELGPSRTQLIEVD